MFNTVSETFFNMLYMFRKPGILLSNFSHRATNLLPKILVLVSILIISNLSYSQNNDVIIDKIYSESIEKLSANSKVKKAFKYIIDIEEKTMKNLIELTEIEAPPFKEEKRAKEFAERLKLAGIENVWILSLIHI